MQLRAIICCAALVAADAVSLRTEVSAQLWLQQHEGSPDELAELKTDNPDAYALVKALLTKRSLGLLDPKHPTASFAAPQHQDNEEHGAEVYAKFATTPKEQEALEGETTNLPYPGASQAAVPFPEAAQQPQDWANWKPHDSEADDEAMVKNVLGAVADLTKGKSSSSSSSLRGSSATEDNTSPFANEVATDMQMPVATSEQVTTSLQTSIQETQKANPYLQSLGSAPASVVPAKSQDASPNGLTGFSWDDSATTTTAALLTAPPSGGANPLASWLGMAKPHVQTAVPVAQKPSNPYLMDLQ